MNETATPDEFRRLLHEPFRPRRGRRMATALGIGAGALFLVIALAAPGSGPGAFSLVDRIGIIVVGATISWFLSRWALVVALPSESDLIVRNLFNQRRLEWPEVVAVRFGGGGPWATLDLTDGESLPILAIQRADGSAAEEQAERLATLVALHTATSQCAQSSADD
jgi:hypothetical protein